MATFTGDGIQCAFSDTYLNFVQLKNDLHSEHIDDFLFSQLFSDLSCHVNSSISFRSIDKLFREEKTND